MSFRVVPANLYLALASQKWKLFLLWLDGVLSVGASWSPVRVLTAAALPANQWNLAAQTKTMDAAGVLTVDGVALVLGNRFWDKDDAVGLRRGLFEVTREGTVSVAAIVTRASDADSSSDFTDGKTFAIQEGTAAGQVRQFTNNAPFVLNTDTPAIGVPADMVTLTTAQTITGAKTFAHQALILRNAAATFATTFSTLASAARAVVWPDGAGTVLLDALAQAVSGLKTFAASTFKQNNDAGTFGTTLRSLATADRAVALSDRAGTLDIASAPQAISGAGVISVENEISVITATGVGDAMTMAAGTYAGQRKWIIQKGTGLNTSVITVTSLSGGTTITLAINQFVMCAWDGTNWLALLGDYTVA